MTFQISYFEGEKDNRPAPVTLDWATLGVALGAKGAPVTACTAETCGKGDNLHVWLDKSGKRREGGCKHKYIGAWSPAAYPAGAARGKNNVGSVSMLVLDLDHMTDAQVGELADKLAPYRWIAHGSHSDGKTNAEGKLERAIRVVIPLSEPVLGTEWPRFWESAIRILGVPADPATCDASRLYFLPATRSDWPFLYETNEGVTLDVPSIMSAAAPAATKLTLDGESEFGAASPELMKRSVDRVMAMGPAIEGQNGDRHTYSICAALIHDHALTEAEAWSILEIWNRTCRPPWALDELKLKLENAKAYAEGPRGAGRLEFEANESLRKLFSVPSSPTLPRAPGTTPSDYPDIDALLFAGAPAALPPAEKGTWEYEYPHALGEVQAKVGENKISVLTTRKALFQAATALLNKERKPTPWLVRGLLIEGGVSMIAGEPKTTKSWLALDIALCVASGEKVIGEFAVPTPRKAAYFFAEDQEDSIINRVRAFAAGRNLDPARFAANAYIQPRGEHLDLLKDEDVAWVVASARMLGPIGLLVLDPLRDIHRGKENESDDMSEVMGRARVIASLLSCTVLVVHHAKKPDKGADDQRAGNALRGSSAIYGTLDALMTFKNTRGDNTTLINDVQSEIKGARGAGKFVTSLVIEDGPDDVAIRASWTFQRMGEAKAATAATKLGDIQVADLMIQIRDIIGVLETRHVQAKRNAIQKELKRGWDVVDAGIAAGMAKMWLQRQDSGAYTLTPEGRAAMGTSVNIAPE